MTKLGQGVGVRADYPIIANFHLKPKILDMILIIHIFLHNSTYIL